jgi:hypothetical protein
LSAFRHISLLILREPQRLVDLDAEIAKCEKRLQLAQLNLDKFRKMEALAGYVKAVPANVRFINEDMVRLASVLVYVFQETLIMRARRGKH